MIGIALALAACAASPPAPPLRAIAGPAAPIEETIASTFSGFSMALDDDHVFWAARDGAIWPKRGGEIELVMLVDEPATTIAIDRTHIYWANGAAGHIKRRRR